MTHRPPADILAALRARPAWFEPPRYVHVADPTDAHCTCPGTPTVQLRTAQLYLGRLGYVWRSQRCPACGAYLWAMESAPDLP